MKCGCSLPDLPDKPADTGGHQSRQRGCLPAKTWVMSTVAHGCYRIVRRARTHRERSGTPMPCTIRSAMRKLIFVLLFVLLLIFLQYPFFSIIIFPFLLNVCHWASLWSGRQCLVSVSMPAGASEPLHPRGIFPYGPAQPFAACHVRLDAGCPEAGHRHAHKGSSPDPQRGTSASAETGERGVTQVR